MRIVKTFAGVVAFILLAAPFCLACDCIELNEAQSFEKADAVVIGEVIRKESHGSDVATVLRVERLLKGERMDEIVITSSMSDCDAALYPGQRYIVYAQRSEREYFASSCLSTRAIADHPRRFTYVHTRSTPSSNGRKILIVTILSVFGFSLVGLVLKKLRAR